MKTTKNIKQIKRLAKKKNLLLFILLNKFMRPRHYKVNIVIENIVNAISENINREV